MCRQVQYMNFVSYRLASHRQVPGKHTALLTVGYTKVNVYTRPSAYHFAHVFSNWFVTEDVITQAFVDKSRD